MAPRSGASWLWVSAGAIAWAAAQVVRSWGRFRAVAAVMVGILLVYGAQGLYYRYVELAGQELAIVRWTADVCERHRHETQTGGLDDHSVLYAAT